MATTSLTKTGATTTSISVTGTYTGSSTKTYKAKMYCNGDNFALKTISGGSLSTSISGTASGLSPDTAYSINVKFYEEDEASVIIQETETMWTDSAQVPDPAPPTPTNFDCDDLFADNTTIVVSWSASANADDYTVQYKKASSSIWQSKTTANTAQGFVSLEPGTNYNFKVRANNSFGSSSYTSEITCSTLESVRPSNFSWDSAKVAGADFNLTASEWNKIRGRISDFRDYKELDAYPYVDGSVVAGDTFTAVMFNDVVNAIDDMNPETSPPSRKSAGDPITASDLNRLVSSLNSIL